MITDGPWTVNYTVYEYWILNWKDDSESDKTWKRKITHTVHTVLVCFGGKKQVHSTNMSILCIGRGQSSVFDGLTFYTSSNFCVITVIQL